MSDNKHTLKTNYKLMEFKAGIFQIKNLKTNRTFLKTSQDLDRAFNSDLFQLKMGGHRNTDLQQDWNALGEENFEFSIVDHLNSDTSDPAFNIVKELKMFLELHRAEFVNSGIELY